MSSHSNQWDEETNNGISVNEYTRSLTLNNPGIFIWKYDGLHIKAKKYIKCGLWTYKIYDKDGSGGNDYH